MKVGSMIKPLYIEKQVNNLQDFLVKGLQKYKMQILFLIGSLLSFFILGFVAIPLIIISYVLVSVISNKMMAKA